MFLSILLIIWVLNVSSHQLHTSLDMVPSDFFVQEINKLKSSVDIIMYKFGDNRIRNAIIDALHRKVNVRLLMDKNENDRKNSDAEKCKEEGAKLKYWDLDRMDILHGKMMVFDGATCFIGSPNFSNDASDSNMEIWLMSNDCDEFRDLFERLWIIARE